jgi:hypothetical protein
MNLGKDFNMNFGEDFVVNSEEDFVVNFEEDFEVNFMEDFEIHGGGFRNEFRRGFFCHRMPNNSYAFGGKKIILEIHLEILPEIHFEILPRKFTSKSSPEN